MDKTKFGATSIPKNIRKGIYLYPLPDETCWNPTFTCCSSRTQCACSTRILPFPTYCTSDFHARPGKDQFANDALDGWRGWGYCSCIMVWHYAFIRILEKAQGKWYSYSITWDTSGISRLSLELPIQVVTLPDPTYLVKPDKITAWSSIATGSILATKVSV